MVERTGRKVRMPKTNSGQVINNILIECRCRFLIFFDDGYASYVGLPELYPICRPCERHLI